MTDVVAGIDRYPRKVTRAMSKAKLKQRSKVKPFVKYVNYNHIMPTRYVADIDLKKVLDDEVLGNPETRIESRKTIKKVFEERYVSTALLVTLCGLYTCSVRVLTCSRVPVTAT